MGGRAGRVIGTVAALAVVAVAVGGCAGDRTLSDDSSLPGPVTSVRLDTSAGGVTLRGDPTASGATVHREVTYSDAAPGPTARVDGGALVLEGCGDDCSVNYTVTVPAGLPVSGSTSAGEVSLSGVGTVDVSTTDGAVALDRVTGDVRVRTSNGEVTGRELTSGRIEADTTNGGIDLTPATAADVRAVTSNGAIMATLPAGSYRVDTRSTNGRPEVSVPSDPAGQHTVDLQTTNGAITVRPG